MVQALELLKVNNYDLKMIILLIKLICYTMYMTMHSIILLLQLLICLRLDLSCSGILSCFQLSVELGKREGFMRFREYSTLIN